MCSKQIDTTGSFTLLLEVDSLTMVFGKKKVKNKMEDSEG